MPGLDSPVQLVILLAVALVVLGPKRLPDFGRSLGKGIREFKDSVSGITDPDTEPEPRRPAAALEPPAEPEREHYPVGEREE
jgi:sec-independent protein translocase protein TatA